MEEFEVSGKGRECRATVTPLTTKYGVLVLLSKVRYDLLPVI